jgi:hypothetical protein
MGFAMLPLQGAYPLEDGYKTDTATQADSMLSEPLLRPILSSVHAPS